MQEVNLFKLMKFYLKRWYFMVAFLLIGVGLGAVYNFVIQKPLYSSSAVLLVVTQNSSSTQTNTAINNYIELFKSRRVLEPVIEDLNLNKTYDSVLDSVDATSDTNTEVIKVTYSSDSADASKKFIDSAIVSFKKQATQLYKTDNIQVIDSASLAEKPYNVHTSQVFILSGFAGLVLSLILLFFIYDHKLTKHEKVEEKLNSIKEQIASELNNLPVNQNNSIELRESNQTKLSREEWFRNQHSFGRTTR